MRHWPGIAILMLLFASPLLADDAVFEIQPVADGIYAAIARPHRPENANAMIAILQNGVLLVDTSSTASSARALVAEIRKLTPKPVRYVVNTHFHWDHFWGNAAIREAFPGVKTISTESARLDMQQMGLGEAYRDRLIKSELPEAFSTWEAQLAKETDPQRLELLRAKMDQWGKATEELKALAMSLPDMTFTDRLILTALGERVEIIAPGRGHTAGDTVVYLPQRRVLASGDLVAGDTPFIADISPYEWIQTLAALEQLNFDTMVPGHGGVIRGKDSLRLWRDYFSELTRLTEQEVVAGTPPDAAVEKISKLLLEEFKDRFPPEFPQAGEGNIRATYRFISGN